MKKALGLLTGLFFIAAVNVWALTITDLTVTGGTNLTGNMTVSATIAGAVGQGLATYQVTSTNGLSRRYFQPTAVSGTSWSDTNWNPYFTGEFTVDVTALDHSGSLTASTTVTVTRTTSGTINSIEYSSIPYTAAGVWSNIDVSAVKLHDIGLIQDFTGVGSVGCNLLNASPTITQNMSEEDRDIAYTDTVGYKPAGTPYRFNVSLHARPRGFMGMGEIKRWIWAPTDTNAPDGPGQLTVDLTSCSPWRSSYSNALQSHVGFAPLFAPASFTMMPTGMIQCTTAHYMDVGPTNTGTQADIRCGLRVNGHTGTNSYVKMFISDAFLLQQFGLTNVYDATNIMAGFVQHFDTNNTPIDTVAQVAVSFTRIPGGTGTNLIYDYNFDGVGDAGYEGRMTFTFASAVAAQMGVASTNIPVPSAPTNLIASKGTYSDRVRLTFDAVSNATSYEGWRNTVDDTNTASKSDVDYTTTTIDDTDAAPGTVYYYWVKAKNATGTSDFSNVDSGYAVGIYKAVAADFDGDAKADAAMFNTNGTWIMKLSGSGYAQVTLTGFLGDSGASALAADFDGDGKADPAVYYDSLELWAIKLSSIGYLAPTVLTSFGGNGWQALAGDFDGDRLADPALYNTNGTWKVKLSTANYTTITSAGLLGYGGWTGIAADFDGDGKVDPAIYQASTGSWIVLLSKANYQIALLDPGFLGSTEYIGMAADFDGDKYADPTVAKISSAHWKIKLSGSGYSLLDLPGFFEEE